MEEYTGGSYVTHLIAGAVAGTAEHCGMFPVDTIKVCNLLWSFSKLSEVCSFFVVLFVIQIFLYDNQFFVISSSALFVLLITSQLSVKFI